MSRSRASTPDNVPAVPQFNDDTLRGVTTLQEAFALLEQHGLTVADATTELGSGFTLTDNKKQFEDVPLMLVKWDFYPGAYGSDFVAAYLITETAGRFIINDGGTGICSQLKQYTTRTGKTNGLLCPRGLTTSDYKFCQECEIACSMHDTECPTCHGESKLGVAQTFYIG